MKLSINWLSKFLVLDGISPEEVASKLSYGSFEVEEIQKVGPKLKGPILVGRILEIAKHPNADRLSVTKVTTDGKNEIQIVCGAKNIEVGQIVPVSLPGALVVNRTDGSELAIKTSKIREIESNGMLCSPSELGLPTTELDGILILPKDCESKLGQSIIDYLCLNQDSVLEVASRSNRGDALSVYGLSKEVRAVCRIKPKEINFKTPKTDKSVQIVQSKIENTTETYVFYTTTIENIKVCESPQWLKKLLESVGIRAINNIVDITNYINFAFGQPMHAYDREKLKGSTLVSRNAKKGEQILTLDGKLRELQEGVLVIADSENPVAIAGIMGGKDSEVTENTKNIVFEAAVFSPVKVRRGSRTVGLTSEASKRFERGVDSTFTHNALLKAIELVEELAMQDNKNFKVGLTYLSGEPIKKECRIQLHINEVKRVLGIDLKNKEIIDLLELLEFKTKSLNEEKLEVLVPPHRTGDISRPIDLIEEIARLYGYDHIHSTPPPSGLSGNKSITILEKIKNHFVANGFSEAYLSSLIGEKILNYKEFPFNASLAVAMLNPLSKEHSVLRQSLLPGLLEALKLNQSHQAINIKLYEIGKVYYRDSSKKPNDAETCVTESLKIAGVVSSLNENWLLNQGDLKDRAEHLYFEVKGIIESLFTRYRCNYNIFPIASLNQEKYLHPKMALTLTLNNKEIGTFGCLHPELQKRFELIGSTMLFEISLEPILSELEKITVFEKISSQPVVLRDITIDISKKHPAGIVISEINKKISGFVQSVNLVSVYELDSESRSLTYRLKIQNIEQTLTSNQIDEEINKIKEHLSACLSARFRV